MALNLDLQINGARDNGTEQGVVSTEVIGGKLIPIPVSPLLSYKDQVGSGSFSYQSQGIYYNSDGTQSGYLVNITAGTANSGTIWFPFYGRTLGVRFRGGTTPMNFTVSVDGGHGIRVVDPEDYHIKENTNGTGLHEVRKITHTDLADEIHFCKVIFHGGCSGVFHGFLVEEGAVGNQKLPRSHGMSLAAAAVTVPTSSTTYAPYPASTGAPLQNISKIIYSNPTASGAVVTWATQADIDAVIINIASNGTYSENFPLGLCSGAFKHRSSIPGLLVAAFGEMYS
jgi:hypothetical protein